MSAHLAKGISRVTAVTLAVSLLVAVPAIATPATPSVSDTSTPDTSPAVETSATPSPSDDASSAINVPLDPETLRFRKELADKQAELDAFMEQLDELDRELALAAEAYNAAIDRLNLTKERVSVAETDLMNAETAYESQLDLLDSHTEETYRNGAYHAIEVLLDSSSLSDFIARVKFLNVIGMADADLAKRLLAQQQYMEGVAAELEGAEMEAEALEFELKARQIEIMLRIQERQNMLTGAQTELLEMLDAEAGRRQFEEAEMLQAILSGASEVGVEVMAGSPVETALAYHGIPYLWGGSTPAGFDCSGLIMYVYEQHGVNLPHYSGSQFLLGAKILPANLMPGDVVFFGSPIHHVGMYIGAGYYLHAPRTGDFVKISRLLDRSDYAGARRYDWTPRVGNPSGGFLPQSTADEILP
ncbi:MAG: NlpC/P60 family protein [Actinomycetota bacterium]|nr:NlpC/P60 family protein [Actinomycetota bacterium]